MGTRNKGQIFPVFLVFITLFMCVIVIYLYFVNQDNLTGSLVSPLVVLETRDLAKVFELAERKIIFETLNDVENSHDFGDEDFNKKFREEFLKRVILEKDITSFFSLGDTYLGEQNVTSGVLESSESFFENVLYPESNFYFKDNSLHFMRSNVEKRYLLEASKVFKNTFQIDFRFNFGEEYLISKKENKFLVEVR